MRETFYARIDTPSAITAQRDWLVIGFRHRHVMALTFLGIFAGAALTAFLMPPRYQSNTKILVKRERQDPLVTPDASNAVAQIPLSPTETELGSEMVLLKSRDLLEAVVRKCGLQNTPRHFWFPPYGKQGAPAKALATAVPDLERALKVELLPKTNLISVTYEDSNPQRVAQVLHTLVDVYVEKHLAVHRPPGTFEFFQQQTQQHNQLLEEAESRLVNFSHKEGVVSPGQQKAATLEKLSEFQSDLERARVAIAETYPTHPVRIIIGFGPGASGDIAARVLAQALTRILGQQFVVENRSGAGSNIASNFVAHAPKDGYTLLQGTVANTINPVITPHLGFDFVKDFAPISLFATLPNILVVHPSLGVRRLDEFIKLAREKPGELS